VTLANRFAGTKAKQVRRSMLEPTIERRPGCSSGCGTSFYLADAAATSWTLLTVSRSCRSGLRDIAVPALTRSETGNYKLL